MSQPNRPNIIYTSGVISNSGDNTIISAPGENFAIWVTHLILQNESATPTTIIIKGSNNLIRCLGQLQGDGISLVFPAGREIRLVTNTHLILNLSGDNSCGYSIGYYIGN